MQHNRRRRQPREIRHRGRLRHGEPLEPRWMLDSTVVFNEIMYNPAGPDESLEFIELHNQMAVDMDLSGWSLAGGVDLQFQQGTVVPGGDYFVIAKDAQAFRQATGLESNAGPYLGQLANGGERIELRDHNDRLMDSIEFDDASPWPIAADGSGASLAKRSPNTSSPPAENWTSSIVRGGTPGRPNFPQVDQADTVTSLIPAGDLWRWDASGTDLAAGWRETTADDSRWRGAPRATLVGYWPLDGNGQATVGADGMLVGAPIAASDRNGQAGGALLFRGPRRQYVDVPGGGGLDGAEQATISMWVKWNGFQDFDCCGPTYGAVMARQANRQFSDNILALDSFDPQDARIVWRQAGGPAPVTITGSTIVGNDRWHHVAVAISPEQSELFVDGISQGTAQGDPLHALAETPLSIGAWSGDGDGYSTSSIDDVAIWDGVLDRQQIAALAHRAATPLDFSGPERAPYLAGQAGDQGTLLPLGPTTYYFRNSFPFDENPSRTQLSLELQVDDGAVVYLNGAEIQRTNMPEGPIAFDTLASTPVGQSPERQTITVAGDDLVVGTNVLAVEVHQAAEPDTDVAFDAQLTAMTRAPGAELSDPPPVAINEMAAATTDAFWIELVNQGDRAVDLDGFVIETSAGDQTVLTGPTLAPGQYRVLGRSQLGFQSEPGVRIDILSPDRSLVVDSARVAETLRGRIPDATGPLLRPDQATPGAENVLTRHDEIVINEIFYHAPAAPSFQGVPPTVSDTTVLPVDATWRYSRDFNFGAGDLPVDPGPGWQAAPHPADSSDWFAGQGPLGFSDRRTPQRITTSLASPALVTNFITTYYFETEFDVTQTQIDVFDQVLLRHMVDDGAAFYINGEPVARWNLPDRDVTAATLATSEIAVATIQEEELLDIKQHLLPLPARNRLSVEVHQASIGSPDIVFAAELVGRTVVDPGQPPRPAEEDGQQWVELLNRGDRVVDLSGWQLDEAIAFEFSAGTRIEPNGYLVVAKDPDVLAHKHPSIADRIVGGYSGQLSHRTDRLVLKDSRGNPADEVEYFENGSWPWQADGGGSSLELRDPDADNSRSLAWGASIEGDYAAWQTYAYQGVAGRSPVGPDGQWNELVLGLLDRGEVLLDDISVVQDPDGQAIELIQNGSFDGDGVGQPPAAWRIIGNHRHSQVVTDPDDPGNQVLRLAATGPTEHMHNHAETTLKNGDQFAEIDRNAQYRISYRAKWLAGSNQLNSRLYFNRLPRTTLLERPHTYGTPGRPNSVYVENLGPTYDGLQHRPAVPQPDQPVTVLVTAEDPDGVGGMRLWYSVAGGPWTDTPMVAAGGGQYRGQMPAQPAGAIVQFFIEGQDALGATTQFPRGGASSRALVQFDDGLAETNGLHNLRLILTNEDADFLHSNVELMSNDMLAATVVYDESEVFYNARVRLSGSERARPFQPRLSFKVAFATEHLFRGVHGSVILDRSESTGFGQRELIYHHGMNHVGGLPTEYNDLVHIITPRRAHTGSAEMQIARVSDIFLDSQFENGAAGPVYEYELIYFPQTTDDGTPEGRKRPQPDGTRGVPIQDMGDDKENYRWTFLTKNNRNADDYSRLIEFAKAMGQRGDAFQQAIGQLIDVDQWLRAFAFSVITGHGDNYGVDGAQHNLQLYIRPADQKVLQFPHDLDAFFNATRPLIANGDLRKLLTVPANEHMYFGHVHDMIQTTFNEQYMQRWTEHFGSFLPRQRFDRHLADLVRRSEFLEREIRRRAPEVEFAVTSGDASIDSRQATISGTGWVDVRELRRAGSRVPLDVEWTGVTDWQASIPVSLGANVVTIEAYDFQGNRVASDAVTITSSAENPVKDTLRITELNFNPAAPTAEELAALGALDNDDFEFIELTNTGASVIDLSGTALTDGVRFVFGSIELAPGSSAVVVGNEEAFRLRYGSQPRVLGVYGGRLNNGGETLKLEDAVGQTVVQFDYRDRWYADADGLGFTLVVASTAADLSVAGNWRPSVQPGGSPGTAEPFRLQPGDANRDQVFSQLDLALALQGGKYLTGDQATWAEGDWNGDRVFDPLDLVAALQAALATL